MNVFLSMLLYLRDIFLLKKGVYLFHHALGNYETVKTIMHLGKTVPSAKYFPVSYFMYSLCTTSAPQGYTEIY